MTAAWPRGLEWEVVHTKSRVHKGRGPTPEEALRDLCHGFEQGIAASLEEIEREQKRLEKLRDMLDESDGDPARAEGSVG